MTEGFLPVVAATSAIPTLVDQQYGDEERLLFAVADALAEEYRIIVDSGLYLPICGTSSTREYRRGHRLRVCTRAIHSASSSQYPMGKVAGAGTRRTTRQCRVVGREVTLDSADATADQQGQPYSLQRFIDEQTIGSSHRWLLMICLLVMWVDAFDVFVVGKIAPAIAAGFHVKFAAITAVFFVQQIGLALGAFAATPLASRSCGGIAGIFLSGLLPAYPIRNLR